MKSFSPTKIRKRKLSRINKLIKQILNSKKSNFYKNNWKNNKFLSFEDLPNLNFKKIFKHKFKNRIYTSEKLFVKIIYKNDIPYLSGRTKKDIAKEDYGEINYTRPLVTFKSPQESMEKCLWLYTKNILPLIAEDDLTITLLSAKNYNIDSIIGDIESVKKTYLKETKYLDTNKILNITIIDSFFDKENIKLFKNIFPKATLQLILALPETGALGKPCRNSDLIFHPVEECLINIENETLIATKTIVLPTPIIKYETGIIIKEEKECSCNTDLSFSLK